MTRIRHRADPSPGQAQFRREQAVEDGSREVVRVALLGPDGPTGTYTSWENASIPW